MYIQKYFGIKQLKLFVIDLVETIIGVRVLLTGEVLQVGEVAVGEVVVGEVVSKILDYILIFDEFW